MRIVAYDQPDEWALRGGYTNGIGFTLDNGWHVRWDAHVTWTRASERDAGGWDEAAQHGPGGWVITPPKTRGQRWLAWSPFDSRQQALAAIAALEAKHMADQLGLSPDLVPTPVMHMNRHRPVIVDTPRRRSGVGAFLAGFFLGGG